MSFPEEGDHEHDGDREHEDSILPDQLTFIYPAMNKMFAVERKSTKFKDFIAVPAVKKYLEAVFPKLLQEKLLSEKLLRENNERRKSDNI